MEISGTVISKAIIESFFMKDLLEAIDMNGSYLWRDAHLSYPKDF